MKPARSVFYVPGSNPKLLAKAGSIAADIVTFDLEDSVPTGEKMRARELVGDHLAAVAGTGTPVYCRINPWSSGLTEGDLEAVVGPHLSGVCLPKTEHPDDVERLAEALGRLEVERGLTEGHTEVQLLIESARGLMHCYEAGQVSPRVVALVFGALDFGRDMKVRPDSAARAVSYPRAFVAVAARACGRAAVDSVFPAYQDPQGFERDTIESRELGYQGRILIHPSQLAPAHRLYCASTEEVDWARRVVEVFERAAIPRGLGAVPLEGMMIDVPVYEAAQRIIERCGGQDLSTEA